MTVFIEKQNKMKQNEKYENISSYCFMKGKNKLLSNDSVFDLSPRGRNGRAKFNINKRTDVRTRGKPIRIQTVI